MRIGHGYDVHRLVEGRKLIIGGVEIEHTLGLLGHSDADVLLHAIMDSLLGAAGLGDIGKHFPDTKAEYKDVSSVVLLKKVANILDENAYIIENIDVEMLQIYMILVKDSMIDVVKNVFNLILKYFIDEISKGSV